MRDGSPDQLLLAWYDRHARTMPWRVSPQDKAKGIRPNPYHVWLSEVMLQQTTVAAVRAYFLKFIALWPSVTDLAQARDADVMAAWAGLGYYARARNLLACARVVADDLGGAFPETYADLLKLPGVGPYTAAAIASIAFEESAVVVDGNVERVMSRLFAVQEPLPKAKSALTGLAASLTPKQRPGDYAQAVMDLGATICTPRSPQCLICPLNGGCRASASGNPTDFPVKAPKAEKPTRRGRLWIVQSGESILIEQRPAKGLLGGMPGFPGDGWDGAGGDAPVSANWRSIGEVRHTFTHFHLILSLSFAQLPLGVNPDRGEFVPLSQFQPDSLPTVMKKAWTLAFKGPAGN